MKNFLKSIEIFTSGKDYYETTDGSLDISLSPEKNDLEDFINAHCIVCTEPLQLEKEHQGLPPIDEAHILDLPFQSCFFESLEGDIYGYQDRIIKGIFVKEKSPRKYIYIILMKDGEHLNLINIISEEGTKIINSLVMSVLNKLKTSSFAIEKHAQKIKIKINGEKTHIKIRKTVFMYPKSMKDRGQELLGHKIPVAVEWSHRWEVRGHWREMKGRIGHDREGNPIKDFTWVSSFVKGPKDAPLVKKVRIIKNEELNI